MEAGTPTTKADQYRTSALKALTLMMFGFLGVCADGNAASADSYSLQQQVAAIVQPQLNQYADTSLGVAVGVVAPGASGVVTTSIFYFGNLVDENNSQIPLNGTTEFEIGSVTKTFTTTVLAALIQERPWLLDLPINRIFPETPRFQGQSVTLRDLADYTSGLPDSNRDGGSPSCTFGSGTIEVCYDLSVLFQHLASPSLSGLQFAPGTAYLYSDLAVSLLALAEPALLGLSANDPQELLSWWEAMVRWIVLEPLGMKRTHAFDPASDPVRLPQGFTLTSSGQTTPTLNHDTSWPAFIGAGGLVSTPKDMMSYLKYNLGLLSSPLNALLPALHTPATMVTTGTSNDDQLALGWFIGILPRSDIALISKNGGVPGFNTQVDFAPSTKTGVFVLANTSGIVDVKKIGSQVMQIVNGLAPAAPSPTSDQP